MHTSFTKEKNLEALSFTKELKEQGVEITNEQEFIERISEVSSWKVALQCLLVNADKFNIFFKQQKDNVKDIKKIFEKYKITPKTESNFISQLVH